MMNAKIAKKMNRFISKSSRTLTRRQCWIKINTPNNDQELNICLLFWEGPAFCVLVSFIEIDKKSCFGLCSLHLWSVAFRWIFDYIHHFFLTPRLLYLDFSTSSCSDLHSASGSPSGGICQPMSESQKELLGLLPLESQKLGYSN